MVENRDLSKTILESQERRPMKALCGALLLLTSLVGSDAFGQAANAERPLEKVSFRLDWSLSGFHLPFYWAAKKGYFKEAGLDVEIKPGAGSQQAINLVAGAHDDLGFADLSLVASSVAKGMKIKAVFAAVQRDAWSIYSHNDRPYFDLKTWSESPSFLRLIISP